VPEYGSFSAESAVFTELFGEMRERGTILDATLAMYVRASANPDDDMSDRCDLGFARALVRRAHSQGIPVAAGTDFSTPADDPFPALHTEIEELVRGGGLTPMAAIESATRIAAAAIGAGDKHGVLAHGRPVSFVLLADNPLDDISAIRSVKAVWKNGERFDRSSYRSRLTEDGPTPEEEPTSGPASPRETLEQWLAMWRRFDLDRVGDLFIRDPALTYFASDSIGLIEGYDAVLAYHQESGFVSGGFQPDAELWLEDVVIADFDDSAILTGVWRFGNRVSRTDAPRGPLTMVIERTSAGYRIAHLHLGNYPREG
jgi:ketosteroid isomerase-like protein